MRRPPYNRPCLINVGRTVISDPLSRVRNALSTTQDGVLFDMQKPINWALESDVIATWLASADLVLSKDSQGPQRVDFDSVLLSGLVEHPILAV